MLHVMHPSVPTVRAAFTRQRRDAIDDQMNQAESDDVSNWARTAVAGAWENIGRNTLPGRLNPTFIE